jgi:2-polyprenyl-3-methyl-5-hydroxy-6-metoxy-1,4-benzoquinol methylase
MILPISNCPVCGAVLSVWLHASDRNQQVSNRQFEVRRCDSCGLGVTRHELSDEELGQYYPAEYYSLDHNLRIEASRVSRALRKSQLVRIQRYVPNGLLLDVGAGTGMFLKSAREAGFAVQGFELSPEAAKFGSTTWGLPIEQGDLNSADLPARHYDVITLRHVFEHLRDPLTCLRKLYDATKANGLLVINVPNLDSLQARMFKNRWYHLDVPRHLYHYTPRSLTSIVEGVGFKTLDIHFFSSEHNWSGILGSLMRLNPPGENVTHKALRKMMGVPVTRALAFLEAAIGRGGTFELYARK